MKMKALLLLCGMAVAAAGHGQIPPRVQSYHLNVAATFAGNGAWGGVLLAQPAPAGGVTIGVSSDASFVIAPTSVLVPAGQTFAKFPIKTTPVSLDSLGNISIKLGSKTLSAPLKVLVPYVRFLALDPYVVAGGKPSQVIVTLQKPAPAGGLTLPLGISAPGTSVSAPSSIFFPAGTTRATALITTPVTAATFTAVIIVDTLYLVDLTVQKS